MSKIGNAGTKRRRAYEARRRQEQRERKHRDEVAAVSATAKEEGRLAGVQQGAATMRSAVLDHAGRLYKDGMDVQAEAVRAVHRLLPTAV